MLPLRDALQEEQIKIFLPVPQAFLRLLFLHCVPLGCLPALSSNREVPSVFYPSQTHWPLKLLALSPTGCKKSRNSARLIFEASYLGEPFSLCIPFCAPLSPFFATRAPSPPQQPQSLSALNHVSALPTFFDRASSLPLGVDLFCQSLS